jgi:hypothetical protein
MIRFGVATPYHCRNGFFMHDQFMTVFPKQIINVTLTTTRDYIKSTSNSDSALGATREASFEDEE